MEDTLTHHGILGQKWGRRKVVEPSGSGSKEGAKSAKKDQGKRRGLLFGNLFKSNKPKERFNPDPKDMGSNKIAKSTKRMKAETEYKQALMKNKQATYDLSKSAASRSWDRGRLQAVEHISREFYATVAGLGTMGVASLASYAMTGDPLAWARYR